MPADQTNLPQVPKPPAKGNGAGPNGLPSYEMLLRRPVKIGQPKTSLKTILKRIALWGMLVWAVAFVYFRYFGYLDIKNHCFITVYPSITQLNNHTVIQGINYLKQNYPEHYANLCRRVNEINPNMSCGGSGGGCYSAFSMFPKRIEVSSLPGDVKAAAGVLAHEACHAKQFYDKRPFDEKECYDVSDIIIYGEKKH